jgi:hypothetical protein
VSNNSFARKGLDSDDVFKVWIECGRNAPAAARKLGCTPSAVRAHVQKIQQSGGVLKGKDHELASLRSHVKTLEAHVLTDERVRKELLKISTEAVEPPKWLATPPKRVTDTAGVPVLFASDWHWGEVVRPAEIGGVNEYNLKIAHERARSFVTVAIDLLKNHLKSGNYPGIVFILGGDMISGEIHEELAQTNELESIPAMLDLLGVLIWCIDTLAKEFGHVFVPCVTGNHGRTTRKPRAKRRNHTNFDWLVYQLLQKHYANDKRVQFLIPEGPDAYFKVYGTRYLLTHGDQFRGGDGMIGALGPISRGDKKKRSRNVQTDRSFDVMLLGHWHSYIHLNRFIVNGTLKGYDEYADANNFDVEPAQQALWITHPDHGITFRMPVFVQRGGVLPKTEWISVPKGG